MTRTTEYFGRPNPEANDPKFEFDLHKLFEPPIPKVGPSKAGGFKSSVAEGPPAPGHAC